MELELKEPRELINIPDEGLVFSSKRIGPLDFVGLRSADYEKGFRMPTIPELVKLVYFSFENRKDLVSSQNVLDTLTFYNLEGLCGDIGILYTSNGMYVQDHPDLREGKIYMNEKKLKRKLSFRREEEGILFSKDRSIRFTPHCFGDDARYCSILDFHNEGVIALVGGRKNAKKLGKCFGLYKEPAFGNSYSWGPKEYSGSPQTKVMSLYSLYYDSSLFFNAYIDESSKGLFSFGVRACKEKE